MSSLLSNQTMLVATLFVSALQAMGWSNPAVRFDVDGTVVCWDRTDDSFTAAHPGYRLYEAKFRISSFQTSSTAPGELSVLISAPSLFVQDYAPRTLLESDVVGNISHNQQSEKNSNIGLTATSSWDLPFAASANASDNRRRSESSQFETRPSKSLVQASGTLRRGTAAFFKFHANSQSSLEGAREVTLWLQAPDDWRADYVTVLCSSKSDDNKVADRDLFTVGLYRAGDGEAKQAADEIVQTERLVRRTASHVVRTRSNKNPFTSIFKSNEPKLPEDWLATVLTSRAASRTFAFEKQLPRDVREAVTALTNAKQQVATFNLSTSQASAIAAN
ncbi:MAG: hypothetical protein R3C28_21450 [Pirellulaceae bacterium]